MLVPPCRFSLLRTTSPAKICCAAFVVLVSIACVSSQVNGSNISQTYPPDQNSQMIAAQAQTAVQQALGSPLKRYQLTSYRYQPVNGGVNYFMKILIQTPAHQPQYVHTRVFQSNVNGGQVTLNGLELNRNLADPISYVFVKLCQ